MIGVREQIAFEIGGRRIEIGDERRVPRRGPEGIGRPHPFFLEDLRHFVDGEPFAKRDRPEGDLAAREHVDDLDGRQRFVEAILARPERSFGPALVDREPERPRIEDHSGVGETTADAGH